MSRRHAAEKREILPDAKYGDKILTKFMNNLMIDGKKRERWVLPDWDCDHGSARGGWLVIDQDGPQRYDLGDETGD